MATQTKPTYVGLKIDSKNTVFIVLAHFLRVLPEIQGNLRQLSNKLKNYKTMKKVKY